MREFALKVCLFLFLVAVLSGRTNALGVVTGAVSGTILLWPLYRKVMPPPLPRPRRRVMVVEEEADSRPGTSYHARLR
jgi:hypothetical protein